MNAATIGWATFLHQVPGLYRRQGDAGRLDLLPVFRQLKQLLQDLPRKERLRIWYNSGTYVRDNGWQLLFAVDVWRGLRRNPSYRGEEASTIDRYERWFDLLSDNTGGRMVAAGAVWAWFHVTLNVMELRRRLSSIFHEKDRNHAAGCD
jgi:hypothetical protein